MLCALALTRPNIWWAYPRWITVKLASLNGMGLEMAADKLKEDREIVLAAVSHKGQALRLGRDKKKQDHPPKRPRRTNHTTRSTFSTRSTL